MPYKDPEKKREHNKLYHIKNRSKLNSKSKKWFNEHREHHRQYMRNYYIRTSDVRKTQEFRDRENRNQTRCRMNDKRRCLEHYSKSSLRCACCNESIYDFLTIDHVNGGGNKHRKSLGLISSNSFFRWLIKNNFPGGYIVLCYNCNCSKGKLGYCPHSRLIDVKITT